MPLIRTVGVPRNAAHINPAVLVLARMISAAAQPWTGQALCAQADPDAFFSESRRQIRMAKDICGRCPVRQPCLDQAMSTREEAGVWGGLDDGERSRLRRRQNSRCGGTGTA
jgi:WhiB family transcriptional regulator, redox-sensing transcriptional regulator